VKVEKGEADGDEKNEKKLKGLQCGDLIVICGDMKLEFVNNEKKKRQDISPYNVF
jgi:hypothetical protein